MYRSTQATLKNCRLEKVKDGTEYDSICSSPPNTEYDEIEGERAFMRAESYNRQLTEDESFIYGL